VRQVVRVARWPWFKVGKFSRHCLARYQPARGAQPPHADSLFVGKAGSWHGRASLGGKPLYAKNIFYPRRNAKECRPAGGCGKGGQQRVRRRVQPDAPMGFGQKGLHLGIDPLDMIAEPIEIRMKIEFTAAQQCGGFQQRGGRKQHEANILVV
jgi:hypothetical protein